MEDEVVLDVQDDGVGFDPTEASRQVGLDHGYGLAALQERAAQLGGSLEIESALRGDNRGTVAAGFR